MSAIQPIGLTPSHGVAVPFKGLWLAKADRVVSFWRNVERCAAGTEIANGLRSGASQAVILQGWGCDMCLLPDGRRQIFALHLPGDLVEVRRTSDLSVRSFVALTRMELVDPCLLAEMDPEDERTAALPQLRSRSGAEDRLFVHMMRLGQLNGHERMLHLFLEIYDRLHAVGLARNGTFRLPLTQEVVADVLGLSIVHVNRTLQQLRRKELITVNGRMITLNQRHRLPAIASYKSSVQPAMSA